MILNLSLRNVQWPYFSWVGQHRDGWHEAGGQGQGNRQGRQSSPPHQEVTRASLVPVCPGKVDSDCSRHHEHKSKYHIVCYHKGARHQRVLWHSGECQTTARYQTFRRTKCFKLFRTQSVLQSQRENRWMSTNPDTSPTHSKLSWEQDHRPKPFMCVCVCVWLSVCV